MKDEGREIPPAPSLQKGGSAPARGDFHPSSLIPHPSDTVDVVAAVIIRPDGSFLLARRPHGKVYAGYWEFPGGKVEPGEAPADALKRELHEELGIEADVAYRWITRWFTYPHARVKLCFFRVIGWHGDPHGHEDQQLSWQFPERVDVAPLLPANDPVLRALNVPVVYGITNAQEAGVEAFMAQLKNALDNGLRMIQVREKNMAKADLRRFAEAVLDCAGRYGAKVLINGDIELARGLGAHGVHLTSAQIKTLTGRPGLALVGASCHTPDELAQARKLDVDFVVLGPVFPTPGHPDTPALGWRAFGDLIRDYTLPVYALGGLRRADLAAAWEHGAHGVAMVRGAWAAVGGTEKPEDGR